MSSDKREAFNKVQAAIDAGGWGSNVDGYKTGHLAYTMAQSSAMFCFLLDLILIQDAEIKNRKASWTKEQLDDLDKLIVAIIRRENSGGSPYNPVNVQHRIDRERIVEEIKQQMCEQNKGETT